MESAYTGWLQIERLGTEATSRAIAPAEIRKGVAHHFSKAVPRFKLTRLGLVKT
ncbi:MAG: hypothetical protein Kow0031_24840 [Anaerolineae bacterium]